MQTIENTSIQPRVTLRTNPGRESILKWPNFAPRFRSGAVPSMSGVVAPESLAPEFAFLARIRVGDRDQKHPAPPTLPAVSVGQELAQTWDCIVEESAPEPQKKASRKAPRKDTKTRNQTAA